MKKQVVIEDVRGEITTGTTMEEIEVGQVVSIEAKDENGMHFEATGTVVEFDEV